MTSLPVGTIEVQVPDCLTQPQPWWESSGMTVVAFILGALIVVAVCTVVLVREDRKGKKS